MTLVELLVVIVLVSTLVATAIPVISPGGDSRKLREASRNVNAYLQGAQARAVQTGRPFGVALERLSADTGQGEHNAVCLRMRYVEVPPAYSGFSATSAVRLASNPAYAADNQTPTRDDDIPLLLQFVTRGTTGATGLPAGWATDLIPPDFLRPGDTVEIAGERYTLVSGGGTQAVAATDGYLQPPAAVNAQVTFGAQPQQMAERGAAAEAPLLNQSYDRFGQPLPGPEALAQRANDPQFTFWTEPRPYRIYRQPAPAGGEPLELPAGIAIDLQASAVGKTRVSAIDPPVTRLYDPGQDYLVSEQAYDVVVDPLMILFSPDGNVHRLHGLLGSRENSTTPRTRLTPQPVTSYIALCLGRRELIPAVPATGTPSPASLSNPINLVTLTTQTPEEVERREITDQYNWLNLESRWVVIGGQSGAVMTTENVAPDFADPALLTTTDGQVNAALEFGRGRTKIGGR